MKDEKPSVRYGAALGLASIADKRGLKVFKEALEDDNPIVRNVAIVGIKAIENKK
ncbi:MAG: HEAT repeat domain-containing protein [Methanobacterium sp.]|nr:HEAT repeat domain-containing protein [Methanobacterium sp.]